MATVLPAAAPAAPTEPRTKRVYVHILPEIRTLAAVLVFEDGFTVSDAALLLRVRKDTLRGILDKMWNARVAEQSQDKTSSNAKHKFSWDHTRERPKVLPPQPPRNRPKVHWPRTAHTKRAEPQSPPLPPSDSEEPPLKKKRAYSYIPFSIKQLAEVLVLQDRFTIADAAAIVHVSSGTLMKHLGRVQKTRKPFVSRLAAGAGAVKSEQTRAEWALRHQRMLSNLAKEQAH